MFCLTSVFFNVYLEIWRGTETYVYERQRERERQRESSQEIFENEREGTCEERERECEREYLEILGEAEAYLQE